MISKTLRTERVEKTNATREWLQQNSPSARRDLYRRVKDKFRSPSAAIFDSDTNAVIFDTPIKNNSIKHDWDVVLQRRMHKSPDWNLFFEKYGYPCLG